MLQLRGATNRLTPLIVEHPSVGDGGSARFAPAWALPASASPAMVLRIRFMERRLCVFFGGSCRFPEASAARAYGTAESNNTKCTCSLSFEHETVSLLFMVGGVTTHAKPSTCAFAIPLLWAAQACVTEFAVLHEVRFAVIPPISPPVVDWPPVV